MYLLMRGGSLATAREHARSSNHGVLPTTRQHPTEASHPAPRRRRQPLLRGTDGRGGVLLRLVAALPPAHSVGDRRRHEVGTARPEHHAEPPAQTAAPQTPQAVPRGDLAGDRRGHRTPPDPRESGRADLLRRFGEGVAAVPQRRSATRWCTSNPELPTSRRFSALSSAESGDYVLLPMATTHRWVPTGDEPLRAYVIEANSHIVPPKRYLSKYGQFLEHAPFCERDLHGPAELVQVEEENVEVLVKHRTSTRHRRHAIRDARTIPSTSSGGTAACTRTRSPFTTSSRSPAVSISRHRRTRRSRATTS